ncbi:unnamed protein product [Leptosia nina]|uniref:Uncharacterized protein n=1 Tax=Leptosia nina TaxID=320188 RepID=A0AAV1ISU6_9NEOP
MDQSDFFAEVSDNEALEFSDFWSSTGIDKQVLQGAKLREEKSKYIEYVKECKPVNIDIETASFKRLSCKRKRKSETSRKRETKTCKAKLFCALFGHRITMKLSPPGCIPMEMSLLNLSEIINEEITQLLHKGKKLRVNKKIQAEISDKVTVWIARVLEDAKMKIMFDDLEELEEQEGHIWDILDDIIETVSEHCKSESMSVIYSKVDDSRTGSYMSIDSNKSSPTFIKTNAIDLENHINGRSESEVTKTDIMQAILSDIISDICGYESTAKISEYMKSVIYDSLSEITSDTEKDLNIINNNEGKDGSKTVEGDNIITIENTKTVSENDLKSLNKSNVPDKLIRNESKSDIVTSYVTDHALTEDEILTKAKDSYEDITNKGNQNDEQGKKDNVIKINEKEHQQDYSKEIPQDSTLNSEEIASNTVLAEKLGNPITDDPTPIYSHSEVEESVDESLKKVKFSNINFESIRRTIDVDAKERFEEEGIFLHKKLSSTSSRSLFKHINFSPPNARLLSDADESWPEDILPPTIKISASASKSVTSLGFIEETDEKLTISPDRDKMKERSKAYLDETFLAELSNVCEEDKESTQASYKNTIDERQRQEKLNSNKNITIEATVGQLDTTNRQNFNEVKQIPNQYVEETFTNDLNNFDESNTNKNESFSNENKSKRNLKSHYDTMKDTPLLPYDQQDTEKTRSDAKHGKEIIKNLAIGANACENNINVSHCYVDSEIKLIESRLITPKKRTQINGNKTSKKQNESR